MSKADALLERYGCLAAVFSERFERIVSLEGEDVAEKLLDVRRAGLSMLRQGIERRPLIGSPAALIEYLHAQLAWRRKEAVHVLFLDAANYLLHDETVSVGSPTEAPIQPREIISKALEVDASGMILAHNHPSGDARPSATDVESSRRLRSIGRTLGLVLHDHLIVTRTGFISMSMLGLLDGSAT